MPKLVSISLVVLVLASTTVEARQATKTAQNDPVVATVNDSSITKSQVLDFLSQYTFPPGRETEVYETAIEALIGMELLDQFLDRQGIEVTEQEIDEEVARVRQQIQQSGSGDLASTLAELNISLAELRDRLSLARRWNKFLEQHATDQVLGEYFRQKEDIFTGAQVKASHILIKLDDDASESDKEAARQKLLGIKQAIEAEKLSFADAANRYSEDDGNIETPDGGNLDYFTRRGQYIDEFCDTAFELEVGQISDPVETEYGYHLILVTDRRPGQEVSFAEMRDQVLEVYGFELRNRAINQLRKQADIDIKPMPDDFFPTPAPAPSVDPTQVTPTPSQ